MIRHLPIALALAGGFSVGAFVLGWLAYRGVGRIWP